MPYGDGLYGSGLYGQTGIGAGRLSGPQLVAGTATTQFTGAARILSVVVANPSGAPVDFTLSLGADSAATRFFDDYQIPADSTWKRNLYLPVNTDEEVQAFASTPDVLVLTIEGTVL